MMQPFAAGQLNAFTILSWTLFSLVVSGGAGAIAGMVLAGKDLGNSLAAMMGGMFGPVAAVPGVLAALIVLTFL